ncbi:MAG: mobile mystery protein A [Saprospiraceae bacterium]
MKLIIKQLDPFFWSIQKRSYWITPPGWIRTIRTALEMSNVQLAKKLNITPQSARELEQREIEGTITLKTLRDVAEKMDMEFEYFLRPKDGTLEALIDRKSQELATKIVLRTSQAMKLEDQEVSEERVKNAIAERAQQIKENSVKLLWN